MSGAGEDGVQKARGGEADVESADGRSPVSGLMLIYGFGSLQSFVLRVLAAAWTARRACHQGLRWRTEAPSVIMTLGDAIIHSCLLTSSQQTMHETKVLAPSI